MWNLASRSVVYVVRPIRARPGVFLVRSVMIGLLVGVGSAVFAVAQGTILAAPPFPESSRLLSALMYAPGVTAITGATPMHPFEFYRLRDSSGAFEMFDGVWLRERALGGADDPESVPTGSVSAGFLPMFGGAIERGRLISEQDARTNARVAVLSHGLWTRRFGRDPGVIGRTIPIDRDSHHIVGVLSQRFSPGFVEADVWTPLHHTPEELRSSRSTTIRAFGRLRAGGSAAQATSIVRNELAVMAPEAGALLKGWDVTLHPLAEALYGEQRPAILLLMVAVAVLAVLSAANLGNLTLADVFSRQSDFATRLALGASRRDLLIPEIMQSLVIGLLGGGAGLLVARAALPALLDAGGGALDAAPIRISWIVITATLLFAVLVMIVTAVLPTLRLYGAQEPAHFHQNGVRTAGTRESARLRRSLLVAQSALALVLLAVTGIVLGAYSRATRLEPGFDASGMLAAQIRLPDNAYKTAEARSAAVDAIVDRVRGVSGVTDATATIASLIPGALFHTLAEIEHQPTANGQPHTVGFRRVTPGYFETMKIGLTSGRLFDSRDTRDGQPVAIVSESFARRFWGRDNPVGRRLRRATPNPQWLVVIGVVPDVYDRGFGVAPQEILYCPYSQGPASPFPVTLMVRTSGEPRQWEKAVAAAVHEVDPLQPVGKTVTLDEFMWASLGPQRFRSVLLLTFAGLGLLIAALGTYGVTARTVVERRREIGIRLALGGTPAVVWRSVAFATLRPILVGSVLGGVFAFLAARALPSLLPDVGTGADSGIAAAASVLLAVAALAAFGAAAEAARVEPLRALRGH